MNGVATAFSRAAAVAPGARPARPRWVRDDRLLVPMGALLWVLVVLMIVPDGFDYAGLTTEAPSTGSALSRLLWMLLLAGGTLALLWRASFAWQVLRRVNPFLIGFLVLALASTAWSLAPEVTARRLVRIVTIVVDALALVVIGWHALRFQNLLRPIITLMLLGSVVFGLGWPDLALHPSDAGELPGPWHGLANHKNSFGDLACMGLVFWFHAGLTRQVRAVSAMAAAALAAACLWLAHSSTSIVAAALTLAFIAMMLRAPRAFARSLPTVVVLIVAALLAYSAALLFWPGLAELLSPVNALTGKDQTFTGRTEIWAITMEHIRLQPYFGSGYGAYWTGATEGTPAYEYVLRMGFYPGSAHNGYLEMLNELGAAGLLVLFGYLIAFAWQAVRLLAYDRAQATLYLALFLQQAITNLSESRWLSVLSVDFVIMTLATAALARALVDQRLRRAAAAARRVAPAQARLHGRTR